MEGASSGRRSYETGFSVRYLAGAVVVVVVHAAAILIVAVAVIIAVVALALLRDPGPLALALERDLGRIDGIKWLVVGGGLGRLGLGGGEVLRDVRCRRVLHRRRAGGLVELVDVVDRGRADRRVIRPAIAPVGTLDHVVVEEAAECGPARSPVGSFVGGDVAEHSPGERMRMLAHRLHLRDRAARDRLRGAELLRVSVRIVVHGPCGGRGLLVGEVHRLVKIQMQLASHSEEYGDLLVEVIDVALGGRIDALRNTRFRFSALKEAWFSIMKVASRNSAFVDSENSGHATFSANQVTLRYFACKRRMKMKKVATCSRSCAGFRR